MAFPFRSPVKNYAPKERASTPYQGPQQAWDMRMGAAVMSARAWRLTAFASLVLAAALVVALTIVALQKRTFVYIAEVSPEGQVMSVRVADGRWTPSSAQITHHVGRFVHLVRSLPTDRVVLAENWREAYKFLTPEAAAQMSEIARRDDPFLSVGRVARTVDVRTVLQRSDGSWEVNWIERAANATGANDGEVYTGVFTVTIRPPRTADEIASNPLGVLITDFSWSRVR